MAAANIVAALTLKFPNGDGSNLGRFEKKMLGSLVGILERLETDEVDVEDDEEIDLAGQDGEDYDPEADVYEGEELKEDDDGPEEKKIKFSKDLISPGRAAEALSFYRSSDKGSRGLATMMSRHRFIKCEDDMKVLREIEKNGTAILHRKTALRGISNLLYQWTIEKMQEGAILHEVDLQREALRINEEHKLVTNFQASRKWIWRWKQVHRIISRRVTKFVSKRAYNNRGQKVKDDAEAFVREIKDFVKAKNIPWSAVANSDQSGFQRILTGNRSLAVQGEKKVLRVVDTVSGTTHSSTVMPIIYADGTISPKLFVVIQEPAGHPPKNFVSPRDNLIVKFNRTHIMNWQLTTEWFLECVVPEMGSEGVLVLDSWTSFKKHAELLALVPSSQTLWILNIPPGSTGMIQPLDVSYFLYMKAYVKKITNYVKLHAIPFLVHRRENILKILGTVHRQFCHARFKSFVQYAWYKGGFLDQKPIYETPLQVAFPNLLNKRCEVPSCHEMYFAVCVYCDRFLCLLYHVDEDHVCF